MATYKSKNPFWRFLVEDLDYDLRENLPTSWVRSSSQAGRIASVYTGFVAAIVLMGVAFTSLTPKNTTADVLAANAAGATITLKSSGGPAAKTRTAPAPVEVAPAPAVAPEVAAPVVQAAPAPAPVAAKKLVRMTMVIAEKGCKANGKRFDCVVRLIDENGKTAPVKDGWQRADLRLKDTKVGAQFGNVVAAINDRPANLTASQAAEYFQVAGFDLQIKYGKEFRYG